MRSAILAGLKKLLRKWWGIEELEEIRRLRQRVCFLSSDEARSLAFEVLRNAEKWSCVRSKPDAAEQENIRQLGDSLQRLFNEYESIDNLWSNFRLNRRTITPSHVAAELLEIGMDTGPSFYLVRKYSDVVYEMDEMEEFDADTASYPSVYHLIAFQGALVSDIKLPESTRE